MIAEVSEVIKGSIAEEAGIQKGDKIISINGLKPKDVIEYKFACAEEYLELEVEKEDGEIWVIEIEKDYDEDLGIEFTSDTFDKISVCRNKCLFCFVDQMPKGLRETLYVKDDDFRLSFLHGNFITLTNLSKADFRRITGYHLSPLYISVHATTPEVRVKLLNNPKAGEIMSLLKELKKHNIEFHAQVVLCPGINDGEVLDKTITDLMGLLPNLLSLAIVPVGITKFHQGSIRTFTTSEAKEVIKTVEHYSQIFYNKTGRYIIAAADELYFLANAPLPETKFYDNFPQYENGVGMTRAFSDEFKKASRKVINFPGKENTIKYLLSGVSGAKALDGLLKEFYERFGIKTEIIPIVNDFFGHSVTVTGLVTGSDIIKTLKERFPKNTGNYKVLIPDCMLKKGHETFLDNLTISQVEDETKVKLHIVETDGAALVKALME